MSYWLPHWQIIVEENFHLFIVQSVAVVGYCYKFLSLYRTLAQFLRQQNKPLGEQEILGIFSQMVDALRYLHDHKILHR